LKLVNTLSGHELDHYVALALGAELTRDSLLNQNKTGFTLSYRENAHRSSLFGPKTRPAQFFLVEPSGIVSPWNPSTNPWLGMHIIETRKISLKFVDDEQPYWLAIPRGATAGNGKFQTDVTPLVAAMRAVVAGTYGREVPE
jgi:hypothetical protein